MICYANLILELIRPESTLLLEGHHFWQKELIRLINRLTGTHRIPGCAKFRRKINHLNLLFH